MSDGAWLLVVVDGPSEVRRDDGGRRDGVVVRLIAQIFGDECAQNVTLMYWRHVRQRLSPLRRRRPQSMKGWAVQARYLSKLGNATGFGTVLLADNDNDSRQDRLGELRRGVAESDMTGRTAVGVARQMLEAWLLADPSLLERPLPAGKTCEMLWGDKDDPASNYPKHVLYRCVQEPRSWTLNEVIEHWQPSAAQAHSPSLRAFMEELDRLAGQYNHYHDPGRS